MKAINSRWSKQPSSKRVEGSLKGGLARRLPKSKWQNQMIQKLIHHQEAFKARIIQSPYSLED
jgi:predicted nuclease of restriction endonuclease-like (RecB) superfamily